MNVIELWGLECRLCNCNYKTSEIKIQICPNIKDHEIQLKSMFDKYLPPSMMHKINSPIHNQCEENNSNDRCVAMCFADLVQYYNNSTCTMSYDSIWDQRKSIDVQGMYIFDALNIVQTIGCTTEAEYHLYKKWLYTENSDQTIKDTVLEDNTNKSPMITYEDIVDMPTFYLADECGPIFTSYGLKIGLTFLGPCILKLPCHKNMGKFWLQSRDFDSSRYSLLPPSSLSHSVIVVGFKENGFIIRNSWGTSWGVNGLGKISEYDFITYNQFCGYFLSTSNLEASLNKFTNCQK